MKFLIIILAIFIPLLVFAEEEKPLQKISADDIKLIKISAKDERAVMKTPDRKLVILKPGDQVGKALKVVEIAEGRVVLEEKKEQGVETIIIRLENDKQSVERMTKIRKEKAQTRVSVSTGETDNRSRSHREQRREEAK